MWKRVSLYGRNRWGLAEVRELGGEFPRRLHQLAVVTGSVRLEPVAVYALGSAAYGRIRGIAPFGLARSPLFALMR
jgi:hypothetical protein